MADWTQDPREIDRLILENQADKRYREQRAAALFGDEVIAEQKVVAAQHERDRVHELRLAEEELAREDAREVDLLLEERRRLVGPEAT